MIQETKLPYQLYSAGTQSPLAALSWHLGRNEIQEGPNAWILLLGSESRGGQEVKKPFNIVINPIEKVVLPFDKFCYELGEQLAQTNYALMTASPNFERLIHGQCNLGFNTSLKKSRKAINSKDYLRHYRLENNGVSESELANATIITYLSAELDRLIQSMTSLPNAAILIGGNESTKDLALKCLQNGRPVFPLAKSGGAAKQFYDLLLENYTYVENDPVETSFANIKVNLQIVYQHPLDVKALDQPYKGAIAEIISHLNMIYAPDDPRMYSKE